MPKTKISASDSIHDPIYNKENVKSKKRELWTSNVQKAFEEAYIMYSWMNDRETKLLAGKHYGRNELIGLYIQEKTNEMRNRKQVSSHIQVLKKKGSLPKVPISTMNVIKNQSLLMANACANIIFNKPVFSPPLWPKKFTISTNGLITGEHVFIDTKINGFHKINQISINQIPIERSDMIIKLYKESTCHMLFFKVKFHAGQIPDYVKIDNVLSMVSESSTQQILLQTRIFFKTKEIRNEENLFWVDKINKKGNYSLSFSPKFMNSLIKEAKSKSKDKIDVFFQKLVIIQTFTDPISKTLLLNVVYQFESGYGAGDDSTSQIYLITPNEEVKFTQQREDVNTIADMNINAITIADVMNTNTNIVMTEYDELLQSALTTTASTFFDDDFNDLFGSCADDSESQIYQTSSFLLPKNNDRYLQLYTTSNIITGNGNDLSSESDDMILEKYLNCNDLSYSPSSSSILSPQSSSLLSSILSSPLSSSSIISNNDKSNINSSNNEIEKIRSEFDSIIAEVMKESGNIVYSINDQFIWEPAAATQKSLFPLLS